MSWNVLKYISKFRTKFFKLCSLDRCSLLMKLCKTILKNLGIRRDLGVITSDKSFCQALHQNFFYARRLKWKTPNNTQNNMIKENLLQLLIFTLLQEKKPFKLWWHSTIQHRAYQWLAALQSHQRGDMPCPTYTTSGQNKLK